MGYREFVDAEGRSWRAWETRPRTGANVRPSLVRGWLSFESEAGRRRLVPVPPGWAEGTEEELRQWLGRAREVAGDEAAVDPPLPPGSPQAELAGRTGTVVRRAREVLRSIEETLRRTGHAPPPE